MHSSFRLSSTPIRNSFGFALSFGPLPGRISPFQLVYFLPRQPHFQLPHERLKNSKWRISTPKRVISDSGIDSGDSCAAAPNLNQRHCAR